MSSFRPALTSYFAKRIFRIFPGYFVCFWVCVLILAPWVNPQLQIFSLRSIWHQTTMVLTLREPDLYWVFSGLQRPSINGSMWTIAYEFRCYVAAAVIGYFGLYTRAHRTKLALLVIALLALTASGRLYNLPDFMSGLFGTAASDTRLLGVFLVGSLYYVFAEKISYSAVGASISAVLLFLLLFSKTLAEPAYAIFGGYLIFWFAFKVRVWSLSRFDNNTDVSYGVYLYAWPIQNLLIWNWPAISPWLVCIVTIAITLLMGLVSWTVVERPALNYLDSRQMEPLT